MSDLNKTAAPELAPNAEHSQQQTQAKQHEKRKKSYGEKAFDWGVYGGLGFAGNELLSAEIMNSTDKQGSALNRFYNACERTLNKWLGPALERFSAKRPIVDHFQIKDFWGASNVKNSVITKPLKIFFMTIGGNLMVIPIRMAEGSKDKLVHSINSMRYGKEKADSPEMQAMHAEMNAEPQQSWSSLIKSRIFTLFGAIGVYVVGGTAHAPTTWAFNGTPVEKWSSLSRITASLVRPFEAWIHPEEKGRIAELAKSSPYEITKADSKFAQRAGNYSTLFTISAVFAALYYFSTRIFAAKRDEKIYKQYSDITQRHAEDGTHAEVAAFEHASPALETATEQSNAVKLAANSETPDAKINTREMHGVLAPASQLAAATV